jgi:hypothetical protein
MEKRIGAEKGEMKRIFLSVLFSGMVLTLVSGCDVVGESPDNFYAVSQPLIREGDFAVKLAESLKIGAPENDADAESLLSSLSVQPRNGWIADFPVTPNILGEVQKSVAEAAEAKKLPMEKEESLTAFQSLLSEEGLSAVSEIPN